MYLIKHYNFVSIHRKNQLCMEISVPLFTFKKYPKKLEYTNILNI